MLLPAQEDLIGNPFQITAQILVLLSVLYRCWPKRGTAELQLEISVPATGIFFVVIAFRKVHMLTLIAIRAPVRRPEYSPASCRTCCWSVVPAITMKGPMTHYVIGYKVRVPLDENGNKSTLQS